MAQRALEQKLRIEFAAPDFFAIPMKKVEVVSDRESGTGRTYFVHKGAIVAVARRGGQDGEARV